VGPQGNWGRSSTKHIIIRRAKKIEGPGTPTHGTPGVNGNGGGTGGGGTRLNWKEPTKKKHAPVNPARGAKRQRGEGRLAHGLPVVDIKKKRGGRNNGAAVQRARTHKQKAAGKKPISGGPRKGREPELKRNVDWQPKGSEREAAQVVNCRGNGGDPGTTRRQ